MTSTLDKLRDEIMGKLKEVEGDEIFRADPLDLSLSASVKQIKLAARAETLMEIYESIVILAGYNEDSDEHEQAGRGAADLPEVRRS